MSFPDIESVMAILAGEIAGSRDHGGTEAPEELEFLCPFQRAGRVGGADQAGTDFALVDIDSFALTRDEAWQLAEDTRSYLTNPPAGYLMVDDVPIDRVTTSVGPTQRPWLNPRVFRFTTTYRVEVREIF